jgi:hypothetical protein
MSETRRLCGVPSEREECCRVNSQGYTLGWYAMPLQGMGSETGLGHRIENELILTQKGIEMNPKNLSVIRSEKRSVPRPGSAPPPWER